MYWDVDDDSLITPQDYLRVVEYIQINGEGESKPTVASTEPVQRGYYTNYIHTLDINLDWSISPQDALVIVNIINANGIQASIDLRFEGFFPDANGDDLISAVDFLIVTNYLNARFPGLSGGESEAFPAPMAEAVPTLSPIGPIAFAARQSPSMPATAESYLQANKELQKIRPNRETQRYASAVDELLTAAELESKMSPSLLTDERWADDFAWTKD